MTADHDEQGHVIDGGLVQAAIDEARDGGVDLSSISLTRVARRAGVSRATLFRRIGNREALEAAVRRQGVDPGTKRTVRERALEAALELIETNGVEALTLDQVAQLAGCSVTSVHTQFDGRDGLLSALFERYSPIASIERLLDRDRPESFQDQVREVYEAIFEVAICRQAVLAALIANVLGRPAGPFSQFARRSAIPRVLDRIGAWLAEEAAKGNCRALPVTIAAPLLLSPAVVHFGARTMLEHKADMPLPPLEEVIDTLTAAFCRAMRPD
jgi:AcrR family transcriptional regulator